VVGNVNSKKRLSRLTVSGKFCSRDVECTRGECLVDRMSMLPSYAPSILIWLTRFPPASTTAMFIGWPISRAFPCYREINFWPFLTD
jgi:hypothetical protein